MRQQQVSDVFPERLSTGTASACNTDVTVQLCSPHPGCCLTPALTTPAISAEWTHPQFCPHLPPKSISHRVSHISHCTKLSKCHVTFPSSFSLAVLLFSWASEPSVLLCALPGDHICTLPNIVHNLILFPHKKSKL